MTSTAQVQLNPLEKAVNAFTVLITNSPLHNGKKKFFIARAGEYDEAAVRAKVESLISSNPVVVFSWTFCPFAQKAKGLLSQLGAQYAAVELDKVPDGKALRAELIKMTNRTSVPNVFIGGRSYGGCNDGPGGAGNLYPDCLFGEPLSSERDRLSGTSRRHIHSNVVVASTKTAERAVEVANSHNDKEVRVRFAPSPTGYLHVGGARTALFNWLYASNVGGKLILRVEDTDLSRSTKESENAVLEDLKWLGIKWAEGPDIGGSHGPYRQSERTDIYKKYVNQLVEQGLAYPCFCTDEELAQMKLEAEKKKLPPVYRGKWATASQEEVEAEKAKGTPYCYRFRVPKNELVTIQDLIRGEVSWNTDNLGDFVLLRSNGQPVYNFCVAVDDALMKITHVIRAEEHLPNTLRQVLIYEALGFPTPIFGHVSLILAPDKSKLSKRHGATSVGEFRQEGYLPEAMLNFLALLGWNDGTEQELFTTEELQQKFSLDRITKSAAVFDKTKLSWMNGQILRALPDEQLEPMVAERWLASGLLKRADSPFVKAAAHICKKSLELVTDGEEELRGLLLYPLEDTLASDRAKPVVEDNFKEVAEAVLQAHDSGELASALESGADGFKKWIKAVGKAQGRKGKRLFMPVRIAMTGGMEGPDVGELLALLNMEQDDVADGVKFVRLPQRMEQLLSWVASH
ncbi:hypothetical protein WJX72_007403 [[Myrmecia] bisecta]|uniref:glutamate--tRNA ligase n=1 Tax=[Myrmecia] bisecta TaxID=41462 RepID=A0AAW1R7G2_9CHLO